jgi:hypothetical protein
MMPLERENNCNAQELLAAVQVMIDLDQWNIMLRMQANDDPKAFIQSVHKHATSVEADIENKTRKVKLALVSFDTTKIIPAIKSFRSVFVCGLADSKISCEDIRDNHIIVIHWKEYDSVLHARDSQEYRDLIAGGFVVDTVALNKIPDNAEVWEYGKPKPERKQA